jgi:lipopolysaccharide core galacturonosyltransferase RgtB
MAFAAAVSTPSDSRPASLRLGSPAIFITGLALFFSFHIALRIFISPMPMLDESWQLVLSQQWSPGYWGHPPLYTWLQIIFFKIFGDSIFALALLKNGLLFGLYAFTYASARIVTRRYDTAVFAALCLLLMPQIAWESQRDLTHSVLLSTTTAATLWSFLRMAEQPSRARHLAFGACAGLALLSKYNSGLFLLGFGIGALFVAPYRKLLVSPRMLLALAACVLVAGPHFLWAMNHSPEAFSSTSKLDFYSYATWSRAAVYVPLKLAHSALPNLIPLGIIYLLVRLKREPVASNSHLVRMLLWGSLASIAILAIMMVVTKAGGIRGRWFQPLFVCAPVLLAAQVSAFPRWLMRVVTWIAFVAAAAVMCLLPINASRGGGSKNHDVTLITLRAVADHSRKAFENADVIVTEDFWIGGALRHEFHKPVALPRAPLTLPTTPQRIVAAFDASKVAEPSRELTEFSRSLLGREATWRVIYLSPAQNRKLTGMRVGIAEVE